MIVDDGSTDGTEELVRGWQKLDEIPIIFVWQENRGKLVAVNRALSMARGELILLLDLDDWCLPEALALLTQAWLSIPTDQRESFSGVTCLCQDTSGQIIGNPFPSDSLDAFPWEVQYRYRVRGEKWGTQRRDLMLRFPFPEIPEEKFVPQSLMWNRIGCKYKKRFINQPLRIYDMSTSGSLSSQKSCLRPAPLDLLCTMPNWLNCRSAS
jgi:glycosyltransferase involved in cell wall biosynthesis